MSEIQDTGKIFVPEKEKPVRRKFPLIIVPAILVLGVMAFIFLMTVYSSMINYNIMKGIFGSQPAGLSNYQKASMNIGNALQNTMIVKIIMLVICGGLSAALCTMYKGMKKPGTVLTTACLWLVPLTLPAFMAALHMIYRVDHTGMFSTGFLFLLSEGLQTISLFCFTGGIFAYLNIRKTGEAGKSAFTGLLAAVVIWLLGNLTTNGMAYSITNGFTNARTFDRYVIGYMSGNINICNALSVIKILLQILIGILPVLYLRRRAGSKSVQQNNAPGEFWLFPIAGIGVLLGLYTTGLIKGNDFNWTSSAMNSITLTLTTGSVGVLIAWSLIRLMSRSSDKVFGIIALVLPTVLSCPFILFFEFSHLKILHTLLAQALTLVFDWRMVLIIITIAFIMRNHTVGRPVSLIVSLALLAGAFSWNGINSAIIYGGIQNDTYVLPFMYYQTMSSINIVSSDGVVSMYGMERRYWPWALMIIAVPLLLGLGSALLTRRAFKEAEPADDSPAAVLGQREGSDGTTEARPEMQKP